MPKKSTQARPPEYGGATGSAPRPSSDTFLEMAAEIIDPVEWVALQMTKLPVKPGMTRGEAMDLVKAVVREGFQMLKRQEAQNNVLCVKTDSKDANEKAEVPK